jgi:hypothetical protein
MGRYVKKSQKALDRILGKKSKNPVDDFFPRIFLTRFFQKNPRIYLTRIGGAPPVNITC